MQSRFPVIGLALALFVGACGGDSKSPTSPSNPGGTSSSKVSFTVFVANSGGTSANFSVTFNGQTTSASSSAGFISKTYEAAAGTYEMTGSYTGVLDITFLPGNVDSHGGVQKASLTSLEGLKPQISNGCAVTYGDFLSTSQRTFRVRFTLTTSTSGVCTYSI